MNSVAIAVSVAAILPAVATSPATSAEMHTLRIRAVGCSDCTVTVQPWRNYRGLTQRIVLRNGQGQAELPLDAGWFGVGVTTSDGMSGGGAEALVVMNYAGFAQGDRVSNRRSRRAPFGTSCAYFYSDMILRFVVKRDPMPKRYWKDPTSGGFRRYLRAWASPQMDSVLTEMYRPTNKGSLGTQNMACMPPNP